MSISTTKITFSPVSAKRHCPSSSAPGAPIKKVKFVRKTPISCCSSDDDDDPIADEDPEAEAPPSVFPRRLNLGESAAYTHGVVDGKAHGQAAKTVSDDKLKRCEEALRKSDSERDDLMAINEQHVLEATAYRNLIDSLERRVAIYRYFGGEDDEGDDDEGDDANDEGDKDDEGDDVPTAEDLDAIDDEGDDVGDSMSMGEKEYDPANQPPFTQDDSENDDHHDDGDDGEAQGKVDERDESDNDSDNYVPSTPIYHRKPSPTFCPRCSPGVNCPCFEL